MSVQKWVVVGMVVLGSALAQEASAQDQAVSFTVRGGIVNGIANLNDAGTADMKETGYNAGAGIKLQLTKYFALRGDVDLARNELKINNAGTGNDLSRLFYDASFQFQYPIKNFTPYIFVGAGAGKLHPAGTSNGDKTVFAGTGGYGVTYTVPGTRLALGFEGKSWLYQLKGLGGHMNGYDKLQYDAAYNATVSYSIPFGGGVRTAGR